MVRVKICGITNLNDAKAVVDAGADALGFIFYKKSKRCVSERDAARIILNLPPFVMPVGVFVNEKERRIKAICSATGIRTIQLHGDETPSFCQRFKGFKIIKAFRVGTDFNFQKLSLYKVDAFLFDAYSEKGYGGTGQAFDWKLLKHYKDATPFILAGGIAPSNIVKALTMARLYAVDASSGVEKLPGRKDHMLVRKLVRQVKRGNPR